MSGPVCVVWRDATFSLDETLGVAIVKTIGWIIEDNDDYVVVASETISYDYVEDYRAMTTVPRENILSLNDLSDDA